MDWWQALAVMAAVVAGAVGATAWMGRELRKLDKEIAELRSEQRSLRENFDRDNALRNEQLAHLRTSVSGWIKEAMGPGTNGAK